MERKHSHKSAVLQISNFFGLTLNHWLRAYVNIRMVNCIESTMLGSELDTYEAIEAAVKETACGRAFLAEHALRARQSDTVKVLAAIERLEQYWLSKNVINGQEQLRESLPELPLVRTGSIAEEAIETTGAPALIPCKRNHPLSEESILCDIAKALEAP